MSLLNDPRTGGIQGLMQQFQQSGSGEVFSSWVGTGQNQPISADQLSRAPGQGQLSQFSQRAGVPAQQAPPVADARDRSEAEGRFLAAGVECDRPRPLDPCGAGEREQDMLTGRCLCGAARYAIEAELGPVVCCHCSQCRRATGTAFATNANVPRAAHRFTAGAELVTEFESSPGKFRGFCSRCGSPLYSRSDADPEALRIRLGTLDQDPGARPVLHIWTAAKAPWFEITDGLPQIPEVPGTGGE